MPKPVRAREMTIAVSTIAMGSGSLMASSVPEPSNGGVPGVPIARRNSRLMPLPARTAPMMMRERVRSSSM